MAWSALLGRSTDVAVTLAGARVYSGIDMELFLFPLPPAGARTLYRAWPSMGIPETRTVLDGAGLAEAVQQIQLLWPMEVDPAPEPAQVPRSPNCSIRPRGAGRGFRLQALACERPTQRPWRKTQREEPERCVSACSLAAGTAPA